MRTVVPMAQGVDQIVVRSYNENTDLARVVEFERRCEAGSGSQVSLLQDVLGDPLCRVRHFSTYSMLVAEIGNEIVGLCRAGIKVLVCGRESPSATSTTTTSITSLNGRRPIVPHATPVYASAGYILGLRVSPFHRRMGIGRKLASRTEEWCREQGAEYVYIATTKDNEASVTLFTERLKYVPVRNPAILIQPVFVHSRQAPSHVEFTKLSADAATAFYKACLGTQEFFPKDIDKVLTHKLCAGTWVATTRGNSASSAGRLCCGGSCRVSENIGTIEESLAGFGANCSRPESWAVLSLWKCDEIFKFEVKGVSLPKRSFAYMSRVVERALPWFRIPSIPNLFTSFGMQFAFGLHAEGSRGHELMTSLFWHAHNIARESGCQMLMTEVGANDPLKKCIPHWNMFSSDDDLWCVKSLHDSDSQVPPRKGDVWRSEQHSLSLPAAEGAITITHSGSNPASFHRSSSSDWSSAPSPISTLFVDPRDV